MKNLKNSTINGKFESLIADDELIGKKFGKLLIKSLFGKASNGTAIYNCVCECGNIAKTRKGRLLNGETTTCGCKNIIDLLGKKIGRLTILKRLDKTKCGNYKWECLCDCGNIVVVKSGSLTREDGTKSCGCIHKEVMKGIMTTHGLSGHDLFFVWGSMKARCENKKEMGYGGRGISVCQEWKNDFKSFFDFAMRTGWENGLEIDRIDTNGNYEPNNCRFVSRVLNCENTRKSKWWVVDGVKYPSARKAALCVGVDRETILRWCGSSPWRDGSIRNKENCYSCLKY